MAYVKTEERAFVNITFLTNIRFTCHHCGTVTEYSNLRTSNFVTKSRCLACGQQIPRHYTDLLQSIKNFVRHDLEHNFDGNCKLEVEIPVIVGNCEPQIIIRERKNE